MPVTRRKPHKYSAPKSCVPRTSRRELPPETKAYAVGAMEAGESQYKLANKLPVSQGALIKLLARTKERAKASNLPLWDPHLHETEPGRGVDKNLLSDEQKKAIIAVATENQDTREKQSWQAIADGDFDHIELPRPLTVTLFENIKYEAGYARRAPGFKPILDGNKKDNRYSWALEHNPDKYDYGDNLGFNFRRVVYTDETPARVGEQRGMLRAWAKPDEAYHPDVKRPKIRNNCALQFYGSFTYDSKGPYHIFGKETNEMKKQAKEALEAENQRNKKQREMLVPTTRAILKEMGEIEVNNRAWA